MSYYERIRRLLTLAGIRRAPYVRQALKAGFKDVNDYLEHVNDKMAFNAMQQLFSNEVVSINSGKILEVGAGTGRYTREIVRYLSENVSIISIEYNYESYYHLVNNTNLADSRITYLHCDFFNSEFNDNEFDIVLIPWFDMTMSLYKWGRLIRESARILNVNGKLCFDFMDSQESLINIIATDSNSPYYMVNGKDLEKIANHFGLQKIHEFKESFNHNKQIAKYHIYTKL